jgi:hypothetical protein
VSLLEAIAKPVKLNMFFRPAKSLGNEVLKPPFSKEGFRRISNTYLIPLPPFKKGGYYYSGCKGWLIPR